MVPHEIADVALRSARFALDGLHGIVVGGPFVLVTDDSGASWRTTAQLTTELRDVALSRDGRFAVAVGASGWIARSVDGGLSFSRAASTSTAALNAIGFSDDRPNEGWAVGEGGTILHTTNGAQSFERLDSPVTVDLNTVADM
jgi:photosystem II stability/assembly factor-like uncharacterized protein